MMADGKKHNVKEQENITLVRIFGQDLRGDKKLFAGLGKIQGISWALANAICKNLKLDKNKKIQDISKEEVTKIEEFIKNPAIPGFLKNRQKDFDDGEDKHLSGADLKLRKEFDIKRLRKIRSYRGTRHAANLPTNATRGESSDEGTEN